jgi:energy-converting hydrogenase Eha subunit A
MTTITTTAAARPLVAADFYTFMALACVATAFLGFIPTYWTPLVAGQFSAHPVVHMHGIAFFSWTIFAVFQTSLVPAGRVALHRSVGLAGISIATLLTVLGLLAALNSLLGRPFSACSRR